MSRFTPDAATIRTLMQSQCIGMIEAKAILRRESILRAVDEAKTIDDVKDILRSLIEDAT
ncbi:hypothetical protein [Oricola sp.]|uniref:hypothetical protein n=1 Tax=Oricola sp. TaxID=1979950 RepID=UPI0025E1EF22|nr:hypothetical protein [Oricola sp.]MCI5073426.1 hypothetical protein [Oricola sp.]